MKIALIVTGLGMGGAECQVCSLCDQFSAIGHRVLLISMAGEIVNQPKSATVELVSLNMTKTPYGFIRAYQQARLLVNDFKPDVVHSHMVHANLFARLLRLTVSMPKLICTAHSSNEGGFVRMLAYSLTDSLCDLSTNVSQEAVDNSVRRGAVPAKRIIAMFNGIDTMRFTFNDSCRNRFRKQLNLSDDAPLIFAVGRLTEAKDYPNLLQAFSLLPKIYNNAHLAIIGAGEEQPKLVAMLADLGLNERVHFLGLKRNVHEWMSAADVFVLSSAWEGFGLVVAEAMASERVVVATDCGGVKEVIGDCGILVPAKNSLALAEGIKQALTLEPTERIAMARAARERVENRFSISSVVNKWLDLYKNDTRI